MSRTFISILARQAPAHSQRATTTSVKATATPSTVYTFTKEVMDFIETTGDKADMSQQESRVSIILTSAFVDVFTLVPIGVAIWGIWVYFSARRRKARKGKFPARGGNDDLEAGTMLGYLGVLPRQPSNTPTMSGALSATTANSANLYRDSNGTLGSGGQTWLTYLSSPLATPPEEPAEDGTFIAGEEEEDEPASPPVKEIEQVTRTKPFKELLESYGPVTPRPASPSPLPFVNAHNPQITEATVSAVEEVESQSVTSRLANANGSVTSLSSTNEWDSRSVSPVSTEEVVATAPARRSSTSNTTIPPGQWMSGRLSLDSQAPEATRAERGISVFQDREKLTRTPPVPFVPDLRGQPSKESVASTIENPPRIRPSLTIPQWYGSKCRAV